MTRSIETPPPPGRRGDEPAGKPFPLQLDMAAASARADLSGSTPVETADGRARGKGHMLALVLGAVAFMAALAAAVSVWVLPWYVREHCIDLAAEHGIDLAVDHARIDSTGFRLIGVHAALAALQGVRAEAAEVDVAMIGFRPQKMTVRGADLTIDGTFGAIDSAFASWRNSPGGGQAGAWAPSSFVIDGAHVVWRSPEGGHTRLEADGAHSEFAWNEADGRGPELELHARSDRVVVAVPGATLGPWRVDIDRSAGGSRVRVGLDPGVPDSCTILVVRNGERTTSVDVNIPRSPLARLGWPEELLGASGKDIQVDATVHYVALGPARADFTARGGIFGMAAPGLGRAIDVAWEGAASGDPGTGLEVKKARLALGPLVGAMSGTLKTYDDGFRVDLTWAAGPVPCGAFAAPLPLLGQPFDIGYVIRALRARASPAAPAAAGERSPVHPGRTPADVRGDVSATAMIAFDSRNLADTKVDFSPEIGCVGSFLSDNGIF